MKLSMRRILGVLILCLYMLHCVPVEAQNLEQSPAFKSGETLKCNFYFNWKFVWVKVGNASLIIRDTIYNGQKAQYMKLLSSTNSVADAFFRMRDTLVTVFTPDLRPLYYRKASEEGKHFYLNQVWYDYSESGNKVRQSFRRNDEPVQYKEEFVNEPVYDMMSLLAYARTLDFTKLKVGTRLTFPVATGKRIEKQHLIYRGKKSTKSDEDKKYDCFRVSLVTEKKGKEKEIINFHVTNDKNHLPILLDLVLNFGSAKARLSHKYGVLHKITSVIDD